ncbi:MAG: glycosyltransferase family 2 protein [Gemmatimonadetes bacterium]|nr:glycosyltransferase family 2 protein [Gemmatimonadota bacterium]
MSARISAAVNTLNEETRLSFALRSLKPWVDEIVVVDMRSDDRTVEVARSFGALVHEHERLGYADPARAFAVGKTTGDWILILDADEIVPRSLARRLRSIADEGACDAVRLPRLNWILGEVIAHAGWGASQDGQVRFFRRGAVRVSADVHRAAQPEPGMRLLDLCRQPDAAIVHFNYVDARDFLERLNRYTSIEASNAAARGEQPSWLREIRRPLQAFLWRYFRLAGWRDGWRGFALAGLMAFYRFSAEVKLREIATGLPAEEIRRRYRAEAERLVGDYESSPRGPA